MTSEFIDLCAVDDIQQGRALGFDLNRSGRDDLFVVRDANGLYAYRNNCPHQHSTLPWRKHEYLNAAGDRIVCSAHGALFDVRSGICTLGAALGTRLDSIALKLSDEGIIQVRRSDVAALRDQ